LFANAYDTLLRIGETVKVMFERFSDSARRVVFFARGQASVLGTEKITPELLLLGMLQENAQELSRLIGAEADSCDGLRKQIEENIPRGNPFSTSADIPVSKEFARIFQHAVEETSGNGISTVQPGHLLIGILREEGCRAAELIRANGADLGIVRERMLKSQ
jgi:ATP-dependent Clp protease ATP-binding subunit ClpC